MRLKISSVILLILFLASVAFSEYYTPGALNLSIQQGSDFSITGIFKDSTGTPINFTGATLKAQFRPTANTSALFATFSTIKTATPGQIKIILHKGQTTALAGKTGYWDMQITTVDNSTSYLLSGQCSIVPTVTKLQ
jgi:hypothetical protein